MNFISLAQKSSTLSSCEPNWGWAKPRGDSVSQPIATILACMGGITTERALVKGLELIDYMMWK